VAKDTRSPERIRHHFEVERELAAQLRKSTREQRTELFKTLYGELFDRVPDHPRLTRRDSPEDSRRKVEVQMRLLTPYLTADTTLLEFAPGDCRLSFAAAKQCRKVIGVDISDQRASDDVTPDNFELIVYDGYALDVANESVDLAFSYQFLEHLHPEDLDTHFSLVHRILRPGGVYVFDTPHRFSGPHDVSRYFGDELQCFHFQEFTSVGMRRQLADKGFRRTFVYRSGRARRDAFTNFANDTAERITAILPKSLRYRLSQRLFQSVTMAAEK
jgi:cyclopropane fatty-acyl-phospholipid synthase-like methyltransferase